MTADQFRALEIVSGNGHSAHHKTDDLLAACVAGFASLTRPGRYESQQLDDLAMPLLETATPRARRQVSASLAQHDVAPRRLVLALANDSIEVAAPLLLRSPVLTTTDLINIIAERGLSHAHIIARRQPIDPLLVPLLENFNDPIIEQSLNSEPLIAPINLDHIVRKPDIQSVSSKSSPRVDKVETLLISQPVPAPVNAAQTLTDHDINAMPLYAMARPTLAEHLIENALFIDDSSFLAALAEALDVSYLRAQTIAGTWPNSQLPIALKALGLSAQDTYLILTAVLGTIHGDREQLREFVHIYRSISTEQAMSALRRWRAEDMNDKLRNKLRVLAENEAEDFTSAANNDSSIIHKKAQ